jgi:DICT domain-containing protein/signal transduction histidine kinase
MIFGAANCWFVTPQFFLEICSQRELYNQSVMKTSNSLLQDLLLVLPNVRPQVYFKASLTALSHAMEDLVLVGKGQPLVIANFQMERFYRQESRRYQRIAQRTDQVYILAAPESNFAAVSSPYFTIPFDGEDDLAQEWHLIIIGEQYAGCIVCQEFASPIDAGSLDQARQFKGIWSFERQVSIQAAKLLLDRILVYRPDLAEQVQQTKQRYGLTEKSLTVTGDRIMEIDARLFADRLVTYLQSNQYKQLKAYRAVTIQERKERLINYITDAVRRSLKPEDIFTVTVKELGQLFNSCRCLLYRYHPDEVSAPIQHEYAADELPKIQGKIWSLAQHPLFKFALGQDKAIAIADITQDLGIQADRDLTATLQRYAIRSCLVVPIRYHQSWLGILELHYCGKEAYIWSDSDRTLVEAIATQVGVALIQAQAYNNLENLNQQLAALERTQSNLIAIVGHELRTPLSTIQVCLESLATEPEMPPDFQQSMLEVALTDSARMRELIQDFLTLSRLEGDWTRWQLESISIQECLDIVLSRFKSRSSLKTLPQIILELPEELPLVHTDGEGTIEVLTKLLDNACKFTAADGQITIHVQLQNIDVNGSKHRSPRTSSPQMLEVIIKDTGRGIEPSQLEAIFARFYQEENFLQRSIGGTGLGLAICRQIVEGLGGKIWAVSAGKNQGSEFHFTLPISSPVENQQMGMQNSKFKVKKLKGRNE